MTALAEYEPPLCADPEEIRWVTPAPRPVLSLVRAPVVEPGLPEATLRRLFGVVLEVLDGTRPVAQLSGVLSSEVYSAMVTRSRASAGRVHRLKSMRQCVVRAGVIEVSATVVVWRKGNHRQWRAVAVAGRLEREGDAWRFTVLRFVAPTARQRL